jgi:hypothetical protein
MTAFQARLLVHGHAVSTSSIAKPLPSALQPLPIIRSIE